MQRVLKLKRNINKQLSKQIQWERWLCMVINNNTFIAAKQPYMNVCVTIV